MSRRTSAPPAIVGQARNGGVAEGRHPGRPTATSRPPTPVTSFTRCRFRTEWPRSGPPPSRNGRGSGPCPHRRPLRRRLSRPLPPADLAAFFTVHRALRKLPARDPIPDPLTSADADAYLPAPPTTKDRAVISPPSTSWSGCGRRDPVRHRRGQPDRTRNDRLRQRILEYYRGV
jgi:hypothetical protein